MNETIIQNGNDFEVKKKKIIALDVDDVLAAFTPHAHDFYNAELEVCDYWCEKSMNTKYGRDDWFNGVLKDNPLFWLTLPVLSNPEDIDFEVSYYISAFPEDMREYREEWLRMNGFPDAPLICTFDKLEKCIELGVDILVDDKPATVRKFQDSPVKALHFMTYYAGFEAIGDSITNLNQVKQFI